MKPFAIFAAGLLLVWTSAGLVRAEDETYEQLLDRGIKADLQLRPEEALTAFEKADALHPETPEVLLRLAKSHSDLLIKSGKSAVARAHGEKALQLSQRAVALSPDNAQAHLSVAVAYGRLTNFVGPKERLHYSKLIKAEVDRSLALDPGDDYAYHVLGRWYAGIANLNPMLRTFAKVVYGDVPAATNAEAVAAMQRAIRIKPDRIAHHAQLARIYSQMDKNALARKEWERVLALPVLEPEDPLEKAAALAALE